MARDFNESKNPILSEDRYAKASHDLSGQGAMTVSGAVNKSILLACILLATSVVSWASPNPIFMGVGVIGGFICVLVSSFRPQYSATTAPLYAAFEGLFLGAISYMYQNAYHGIVFQAFTLTIGLLFGMLFLYKAKIIVVTEKLRAGIMMATFAVLAVYLVSWILSFFGVAVPMLHDSGAMGIGISLVIIGIASMNLLLDFDIIDRGAEHGAPKYMEWYSAMALMVTIVWLYMELLRLLSKLNRR